MITVTKPFLPPLSEFQDRVAEIFDRQWLTNHGPLVHDLEDKLKDFLEVDYLQFVTNGTLALQIAIKGLDLKGEVITTPFSYVATTSSLVWEGCKPVFGDIDPDSFNIDPVKIEEKITDQTTAILATHVFGNPCDIESIESIASEYNLKVIYDGAHSFGVRYKGNSIYKHGDYSILSFHATKLFHTVEGGAVVTGNAELDDRVSNLKNFGHDGYEAFNGLGINGKNSEFHAAMGLCNLKYIKDILTKYKALYSLYLNELSGLSQVRFQKINADCDYNYAYFPIVFESEELMLKVKKVLEARNIFPRRYFYPSLSKLDYVKKSIVPITEQISSCILCLPLFYELSKEEILEICSILKQSFLNG